MVRGATADDRRFDCPICGACERHFQPFGLFPRPNAQCPGCGALERHRLVWLSFERHTDLLAGGPKKFLHFAPEPCLAARLARLPNLDYTTADLSNPAALVQ